MSWTAIAWAKNQRTGSPTRKAVLMCLAECSNHMGENCYPSHSYIAFVCECSERTVERSVQDLEHRRLVMRWRRRKPDGKYGGYSYKLPIEQARLALGEPAEYPPDKLSTGQIDQWTDETPATRQICPQPPDTVSGPEPGEEPPIEPGEHTRAREAVDNSDTPELGQPDVHGAILCFDGVRIDTSAAPPGLNSMAILDLLGWLRDRDPRWRPSIFGVRQTLREIAKAAEKGWDPEEVIGIWQQAGWSTFMAHYLDGKKPDATSGSAQGLTDAEIDDTWQAVLEIADRGGTIADIDKRVMGIVSAMGGPPHLASLNETQRAKAREKFAERLRLERERKTAAAGG